MDYVGRMKEFESTKQLIDEVLDMLSLELLLGLNHPVKVCFHQFAHKVYFTENISRISIRHDFKLTYPSRGT